jgi:hypothetical protein
MKLRQLFIAVIGSALLLSPIVLQAQEQQESVAEAARKARAEKKASTKPVVVISNDNLDAIKGNVSVVGETPASPPADADKAKAEDKTNPPKDEAYWRKKFADARKKLADDSHELDVDQRDYNLKRTQFYTDPTVQLKEEYTSEDLTKSKAAIDTMTAAVAADNQAIADLQDELRQAGGEPGWANEPQ